MTRTPTTYWDYIKVEELLALQNGLAPDATTLSNDEVMFIPRHVGGADDPRPEDSPPAAREAREMYGFASAS